MAKEGDQICTEGHCVKPDENVEALLSTDKGMVELARLVISQKVDPTAPVAKGEPPLIEAVFALKMDGMQSCAKFSRRALLPTEEVLKPAAAELLAACLHAGAEPKLASPQRPAMILFKAVVALDGRLWPALMAAQAKLD